MLHTLPKITAKQKKRRGRGWSSGAGKYSGRGIKGQKARGSIPLNFSGGGLPMSKSTPMLRGKMKNKPYKKVITISLHTLEQSKHFKDGSTVTMASLIEAGLLRSSEARTVVPRIVGQGTLTKKLNVKIGASQPAIKKIIHAGGEITL